LSSTLRAIEISNRDRVGSFITLDGSTIRELAGRVAPSTSEHQSLAEATLPAGGQTIDHRHRESEEIYYFIAGRGRMRLGGREFHIVAGDCVVIPPGTPHKLWAEAAGDLVLLCACAPPYSNDDTELLEEPSTGG
jgi:mannose-6-phosphate isomerase-like protein (cupin superfamily)